MDTKRKLLNSREAAEYLGLSLSYFRKLMMRRVIPMYKPGGKVCFFDPDDLNAYLTSIRISSQTEIEDEATNYLANNKLNH
ncbi:MAG: excisionase family DNA-binding protein [Muribaculaceae bacterium]|nr:excisionase family DNA-binding protein [Muribaculaceae bacterium]